MNKNKSKKKNISNKTQKLKIKFLLKTKKGGGKIKQIKHKIQKMSKNSALKTGLTFGKKQKFLENRISNLKVKKNVTPEKFTKLNQQKLNKYMYITSGAQQANKTYKRNSKFYENKVISRKPKKMTNKDFAIRTALKEQFNSIQGNKSKFISPVYGDNFFIKAPLNVIEKAINDANKNIKVKPLELNLFKKISGTDCKTRRNSIKSITSGNSGYETNA